MVGAVNTLDLQQAALFLRISSEELRRRARMGVIPGAKVGKRWVFIVEDLAEYLRSLYAAPRQALRVTLRKEIECHSSNAVVPGGLTSPQQAASELDALLARKIERKPKNFTTS